MRRTSSGTTPHHRSIDELDTDLLTTLKRAEDACPRSSAHPHVLHEASATGRGHEPGRAYAGLSPLGGGRLAYTVSPSTCTSYVGTSAAAGPLSSLPVRTSNCAKWSGHSMMCPSSVPFERGACRWPQESKSP